MEVQPGPRDATGWEHWKVRYRLCCKFPHQGLFLIIDDIAQELN